MHVLVAMIDNDAFNGEMLLSTVIGLIVGAVSSLIVNIALVEISLTSFFALYYGLFFLIFGAALVYKANTATNNSLSNDHFKGKKSVLMGFGIFTIASGFASILLDKNWFASIGVLTKIPLYMMLGSSICFVIVLSVIDLVNFIASHVGKLDYRSVIDKPAQIFSLTIISLVTGAIYGLLFGFMDVEDADKFTSQVVLLKEEKYCLVIGVLLGAIGGMMNELARRNITKQLFKQVQKDPFDEEI